MAGPKKKEKLTKPGIGYKFEKAMTKFANEQTKAGVGFMSMAEYIAKGMPHDYGRTVDKLLAKYGATAEKVLKRRKKTLQKLRFKSIKKQKQKKKD